ncbi:hypothetical protein CAPTEDRAFT_202879 [Capitella teleta]|uniref:Endonuclease/exonuclease/phosphatase domain-containing protein n=1 Tax=Capitella teleta TaxID=283909 RepID=R7V7X1_CAPTE|nr:hypothetical protein CAPTEDRAFT_202879 [Capitella teleta]|eukprot:ELU14634.1 hypothetical protein CAPTEDRAFT_202879 [Capitella teleta]
MTLIQHLMSRFTYFAMKFPDKTFSLVKRLFIATTKKTSNIVIMGDFNINVASPSPYADRLKTILYDFNFQQHVTDATHVNGHTIDLIMSLTHEHLSIKLIDVDRAAPISSHLLSPTELLYRQDMSLIEYEYITRVQTGMMPGSRSDKGLTASSSAISQEEMGTCYCELSKPRSYTVETLKNRTFRRNRKKNIKEIPIKAAKEHKLSFVQLC